MCEPNSFEDSGAANSCNIPIYDVDYFINKFEAIPEELWGVDEYNKNGICCALGHCGNKADSITSTDEARKLKYLFHYELSKEMVTRVNDHNSKEYRQPTAKQRILAALRDIKTKQDGKRK